MSHQCYVWAIVFNSRLFDYRKSNDLENDECFQFVLRLKLNNIYEVLLLNNETDVASSKNVGQTSALKCVTFYFSFKPDCTHTFYVSLNMRKGSFQNGL